MSCTDVAIIGAGPYGLSVAAHLKGAGVSFRLFGRPMETWRDQMPAGMLLKSDGFASNLSDPEGVFPLETFCREHSIPYDHTRVPVKLDTFATYGLEFQRRLLPEAEEIKVVKLERSADGFQLSLENGQVVSARRVVVATGISYYAYVPPALEKLTAGSLLHSGEVKEPGEFRGRSVAIVGSGASGLDLAALLHEAGAEVQVLARRSAVRFHNPPPAKPRSLLARLRMPASGIGPGWRSRLMTDVPGLYRLLPLHLRLDIVRRHLGPSAGWPMRERVEGKVPIHTGVTPISGECKGGRVHLELSRADGGRMDVTVDSVIAATGYRVDLRRLRFLEDTLRNEIRSAENTPLLSRRFETSVPGLFFIGVSAATSFGPMMRFAFGADYTAKRVSSHLARAAKRRGVLVSEPIPAT